MKKRMLKIIATVLSLVLVFSSVSVASSAEETEEKYPVIKGVEDFNLDEITTNKSETVFLAKADHTKEDYATLMLSDDLVEYDVMNIRSALPEDTEYYEIAHYLVKDDLFVFVVFLYDIEVGFDENEDGYVEQLYYLGTQIVTTTDFADYESYAFTVNQDNEDVYWETENYADLASFGYVGDTFVYANTDYIVTKETDYELYGKGVYYTTKDFVNWKICYTPEVILFTVPHENNLIIPGVYYFYYPKYTVFKNSLVFDILEFCFEENPYGDVTEKTALKSTYITADFKEYKKIFDLSSGLKYYDCGYAYFEKHPESVFMIKKYTDSSKESYMAIVSADVKTGKLKTVYSEKSKGYNDIYATGSGVYFTLWDEFSGSYLYAFGDDYKFSQALYTSSLAGYYGYVMNNKLYVPDGTTTYVFDDGQCFEYRFSDALYEGYTLQKMITLENGTVAIAKNDETKDLVLIDGILKIGDADLNSSINSADALKILQQSTGLASLSDEALSVADINEDGEINANDALKVLQYSTGLVYTLT